MAVIRNILAAFAKPLCWIGLTVAVAGIWILDASGPVTLPIRILQLLAFSLLTLVTWLAYFEAGLWRVGERLILFRAVLELGQSLPFIPGRCDLLDWSLDCLGIGVAMGALWLARKAWRRFVAEWQEGSSRQNVVIRSSCEIIDMKEWKRRADATARSATIAGNRRR